MKMTREIEIMPTDSDIEELYNLRKELGIADESYEEFYKKTKRPLKAIVG